MTVTDPFAPANLDAPAVFDVNDATVDEAKEYVEANPDSLAEVLEAELAGDNRVTLVEWLEARVPFDPSDHTVDEVNEYLESADADEVARVRGLEEADKNRSTVVYPEANVESNGDDAGPSAPESAKADDEVNAGGE